MNVDEVLVGRFEAERVHLRGVAFRMLGSLEDAEDAVQQTWLSVSQTDVRGVQNLSGLVDHRDRPALSGHVAGQEAARGGCAAR